MSFAKFIVIQPGHATREIPFDTDLVAIGRALDNTISLEDDSNVSRYHAEIEKRGAEFWLIDLGSSNGTTVNDQPIDLEQPLRDGDLIGIGGSTIIEFHLSDTPWNVAEERYEERYAPAAPEPTQFSTPSVSAPSVPAMSGQSVATSVPIVNPTGFAQSPVAVVQPSGGLSPLLLIGAIGGGLLLTGVVAFVIIITRPGPCQVTVRVASPQSGTTIKGPVPIRVDPVDPQETKCVDRVIYQLDGVKIASSEIPPYGAVLDPADLAGLTAGNHILTVVVEDVKGNRNIQPEEVVLGFEKAQAKLPENNETPGPSTPGGGETPNGPQRQTLSTLDYQRMSNQLAKEVSAKNEYSFDSELLHQIEARTGEYSVAGFYKRAHEFRDVINDSFINENGLDAPLGYIMAMSRSRFMVSPDGSNPSAQGQGLWRIPLPLAQNAGYLGRCGTQTLSDPNQKCAALVAAAYMKTLVIDLWGGDSLYAVACFGMTPKEAAEWRDKLPPDRRDLWKVINSAEQRERLIRFFAAGIVAEHPEKFGLMTDSPLSNLHPKR